jgi:hypothetical protein
VGAARGGRGAACEKGGWKWPEEKIGQVTDMLRNAWWLPCEHLSVAPADAVQESTRVHVDSPYQNRNI